jgi:hypothetical protein
MFGMIKKTFSVVTSAVKKVSNSAKAFGLALVGLAIANGVPVHAAALAAPDMTDATGSVTNVFGAVLGVAVLIFGFKKVKSLL